MKPSLVLKMGQQLTMTPQLQQAIRLLQLSTLDLQQEIQEALESNPMLERQEDGDDFDNSDPLADGAEQAASAPQESPLQESATPSVESLDDDQWSERIPSELPVDTAWEDIYQTSASTCPATTMTSGTSPRAPAAARACTATCSGRSTWHRCRTPIG